LLYTTLNQLASLDQLAAFDEIIDVRTPLEYAEDHIPGALNAPVLSNEERVVVGTMYKQVSPHEATRLGAAMVARNIAQHLETTFADRPRNWKPLIYCWRGGKRSESMTAWFNLIGWKARRLDGGYKTYRRGIVAALETLPASMRYVVLAGHTGSGKTRLLHALERAGAQTLDLEALASHRGSLLGAVPGHPQPTQKSFDSALIRRLHGFDPAEPVFIEAESKRIGLLTLPDALLQRMHAAPCVAVKVEQEERITLLLEDYAHLFERPDLLRVQLVKLTELHGHKLIGEWQALLAADERRALFESLIARHYDPAYARSSGKHFRQLPQALHFPFRPTAPDIVEQVRGLLEYDWLHAEMPAQADLGTPS
jgi:tRNA 2-selenouridine synthase